MLWAWLSQRWRSWRSALPVVWPGTVLFEGTSVKPHHVDSTLITNRTDLAAIAQPQGGVDAGGVDALAGIFLSAQTAITRINDNGDGATRAVPTLGMNSTTKKPGRTGSCERWRSNTERNSEDGSLDDT